MNDILIKINKYEKVFSIKCLTIYRKKVIGFKQL